MNQCLIASDPGIDDLVALMLLAKLTPGQSHCLISSFGNAPVDLAGINVQEFISFVAPAWTYLQGSSTPLSGKLEHPWPDYFHGPDGVWGIHPKTNIKDTKVLKSYPNYDQLISLCPLTEAYKIGKVVNLKKATIMGGAFTIRGNETLYAETNVAFDPDAAAKFFQSCNEVEVQVVPLDMTRKVAWPLEIVKAIPETSRQSAWIKRVLLAWFKNYNHEREESFNLHDPLAVYLTFFPEKAVWKKSGIRVITDGKKRGQTVLDKSQSLCGIAWDLIDPISIANDIFSILFKQ